MQQKKRLSKNKLAAITAVTIFTFALAGTTCGTFAWFVYATRTSASAEGVTIGSGDLQMGIDSPARLSDYSSHGLIEDNSLAGHRIYWFKDKEVTAGNINYVLSSLGYGTTSLFATTSRKFNPSEFTGHFELYKAPDTKVNALAPTRFYLHLPLIFRHENGLEPGVYDSNVNIYMPKVRIDSLEEEINIHRSIRFFVDDHCGNTHLINPSSNEDGETNVGGSLDLSGDGFYDLYEDGGKEYEYSYGQMKSTVYKDEPESEDSDIPKEKRTTFFSRHKAGTYALDEELSVPEVAEYEGFPRFRNKLTPVTRTNSATNNYAYLDLTIYCEGWDLSVINSNAGHPFSMDLTFEIDY